MAPSLIGRLLFSGVFIASALDHFQDMEGTIEYAKSKDAPMAETIVPFSVGMAAFGALGVILWRVPKLALGAIISFLFGVSPVMHDFWNQEGQQRSAEQNSFLKNVSILGAAIALLSVESAETANTDENADR
jgi:putative oxidoreductase